MQRSLRWRHTPFPPAGTPYGGGSSDTTGNGTGGDSVYLESLGYVYNPETGFYTMPYTPDPTPDASIPYDGGTYDNSYDYSNPGDSGGDSYDFSDSERRSFEGIGRIRRKPGNEGGRALFCTGPHQVTPSGFEPERREPKSLVLPLHYGVVCQSRPLGRTASRYSTIRAP